MFRSLLTPLVARFDTSSLQSPSLPAFPSTPITPRTPTSSFHTDSVDLNPEDFARDVLIELMRNSVERLKGADDTQSKLETMAEIQRIMLEDACTKDVFRELDGFLALLSVLSGLHLPREGDVSPVVEPDDQIRADMIEGARLSFAIAAEAMANHDENKKAFKLHVGYESLAQATRSLAMDPWTKDHTLGFLLSFAMADFAVSSVFVDLREIAYADLDATITALEPRLSVIRHPEAVSILWELVAELAEHDPTLRYATYKLLERLCTLSHRNHVTLSSLGFVSPLFTRFYALKASGELQPQERAVMQKLLRRLLEAGTTSTAEARTIFQKAVQDDDKLDPDVLEIVRAAMKAKWPSHFSLENRASLTLSEDGVRGLPAAGFTFMAWLLVEQLPADVNCTLFGFRLGTRWIVNLDLRPDGRLEFQSSGYRGTAVFAKATIPSSRWAHVTLVHHPHRATTPTIRLFIDGVLCDSANWTYPKSEWTAQTATYVIGDDEIDTKISWCIASAHLLALPLSDDIPRLIQHLGPRYSANFQAADLIKFLTYESSTSLNVFLSSSATTSAAAAASPLLKAIKNGIGLGEAHIVFSVNSISFDDSADAPPSRWDRRREASDDAPARPRGFQKTGDVFLARAYCLDLAVWKIGGASLVLRLVQLANTPHELSRALGILTDSLRNSWQNSEDMERLRGYDILALMLKTKSHLLNVTGFETVFEFLGLNFRNPESSVVVNTVAYRSIALDFELWSRTRRDIQLAHLAHFKTLTHTSRFSRFNAKQRFVKMSVVRRMLFVLQTDLYHPEVVPALVEALQFTVQAHLSTDEVIKPIVSYLAASLHEDISQAASPRSVISLVDQTHARDKAEQVLVALVSVLSSPSLHTKFAAALPVSRICLLLLGDRPSPVVATQILHLINICLTASSSFSRKFELVSGWIIMKAVLPAAWDQNVHAAAFDVLLGRTSGADKKGKGKDVPTVMCPHICPAIISSLRRGLQSIVAQIQYGPQSPVENEASSSSSPPPSAAFSTVELLLEELIELHSSSPTFRHIFKSQQTTQLYIDAYRDYVIALCDQNPVDRAPIRLLEKLTHLALTLALDPDVAGSQKREILDTLHQGESLTDGGALPTDIDPSLVADERPMHRRLLSGKISSSVGERTATKASLRILEWRRTIVKSERKRLRKSLLDLRENNRQISMLREWVLPLITERGLWCRAQKPISWRLDETEGPTRIRKKLEPENEKALDSRVDGMEYGVDLQHVEADVQSITQMERPPWADDYEFTSTDIDEDRQLAEDIIDDKHRRVRHELEPGDVIEAVNTVARISGVDSSPGLLIFGRTHLYMLDGLVEDDDGHVVDAVDAPKKLFFVPGSIVELHGPQRAHRWTYEQVASFSDRTFLFRDVAVELYFKDSQSLLAVFIDRDERENFTARLAAIISSHRAADPSTPGHGTPGMLKTPGRGKMGSRMFSGFRADSLSTAQRKWQAREISNFTYLSILNQISGRTPSDATQYPIFPWVLKDYSSDDLDLKDPSVYRDLTCPMGAQNTARRESACIRYESLTGVGEVPFHYGTHFSSSMIVCHFLIRLEPFTHMFKTLQGGDWDLPDRLFSDIQRAFDSASKDSRGDVRELIPEFFTCPEFLENVARLDFGVTQNTGERIDDVKLPPWAREDPLLFITLNRKALESDYVSENLPAWIDLIWGHKQRDPDSLNVFHPLSYEGSIDLDAITDDLEREATVGIIHNFGQTPRKLFQLPHPERYMHGTSSLPIGTLAGVMEDYRYLKRSDKHVKDLGAGVAVAKIVVDMVGERIIPCKDGVLAVPNYPHVQVDWGPTRLGKNGGGELRLVVDNKIVQVVEAVYPSCAAFADSENLATGSSDYTVRLWRISRGTLTAGNTPSGLTLSHIMRVHTDEVVCITASRSWSAVISGSRDGTAAIWDLNRGTYVRSIVHGTGEGTEVTSVAVNESTGNIATCSRSKLCLHTINARPIAEFDLTKSRSASPFFTLTSLAFLERDYSHVGILATGTSDGTIVLMTWNADGTPVGEKAKWKIETLRTLTARGEDWRQKAITPVVTALQFVGERLYHGDDNGKVYSWDIPD